jgi:anti-anti-sigma regulatory factor
VMVKCEEGTIHLEGRCRIEDAETLLQALQQSPNCVVDIRNAERLHTAVVQVLLAASRPIRGAWQHGFLARYAVLIHLAEASESKH